ncbi:hypothetical protein C8J56DRAFT_345611 [Mycena floridula]|nr:hypothetical protein C8J56DRAFT_345611 [Mycena floridula]
MRELYSHRLDESAFQAHPELVVSRHRKQPRFTSPNPVFFQSKFRLDHSCPQLVAPIISPFCWSSGQTQSSSEASLGRISEFSSSIRKNNRAFHHSRGMRWDSSLRNFTDGDSGKTVRAKLNGSHCISHHVQFLEPHMDLSTSRFLARISLSLASQGNDWRERMNLFRIDRAAKDWN